MDILHGNECRVKGMDNLYSKQEVGCIDQSLLWSYHSRRSVDEKLDDQCQYIDMDLAMKPTHCQTIEGGTRLRKSKDSEDFEFTVSSFNLDVLEPEQAAPADELFYKGKLLPLQPDPRLQLVQTLSSTGKIQCETEVLSQRLSSHSLGAENTTFGSSGFDEMTLRTTLIDSRCSSSCSQNSGFWESGEKDTGDSSSSRDSNGSSQDSCFRGERGTSPLGKSQSHKLQNQSVGRPPFSWKSLFRGLKKAPKYWVDNREERCTRLGSDNYKQKRQNNLPLMLSFGKASSKQAASSIQQSNSINRTNLQAGCIAREKSKMPAEAQVPIEGTKWNVISSSVKSHGQIDKDKHRTSWHSKERWRRYVKMLRPLYVKISQKHEESGLFRHLRMDDCGRAFAIMDGTTAPSVQSPLGRKTSQAYSVNLNSDYSSRYLTIASCPVSMLSSPNHSGMLAVLDKESSTMQEIQSAIQSAIAHCKQSQVGNR